MQTQKDDLRIGEVNRSRLMLGQTMRHHRATLKVEGDAFVMEGPSGRHALKIIVTDNERLSAHWRVFATDQRNLVG